MDGSILVARIIIQFSQQSITIRTHLERDAAAFCRDTSGSDERRADLEKVCLSRAQIITAQRICKQSIGLLLAAANVAENGKLERMRT